MSLSDKLKNASDDSLYRFCRIGLILLDESIPLEERKYLKEVLDLPEGTPGRISNTNLYKIFREEQYDMSLSTVDRHRRQSCGCFKKVGGK